MPKKCFFCMEEIKGEAYELPVVPGFCHSSHFDGVYGYREGDKCYVYACSKCYPAVEGDAEGIVMCDRCERYTWWRDARFSTEEEWWPEGPYEVLCEECYEELLSERRFVITLDVIVQAKNEEEAERCFYRLVQELGDRLRSAGVKHVLHRETSELDYEPDLSNDWL